MPLAKLHFSISGEFITGQARKFWQEAEYKKAFNLLGCLIGITLEQQIAVVEGRKQFTGVNELDLVDDDWERPSNYPLFSEMLGYADGHAELRERRVEEAKACLNRCARYALGFDFDEERDYRVQWNAAVHIMGEDAAIAALEEAKERLEDEASNAEKALRSREAWLTGSALVPSVEKAAFIAKFTMDAQMRMAGFEPSALPSTAAMLNRGYGSEPGLDPMMESVNGWLLPNGRYYGCGSMEHAGLAHGLINDDTVEDPEKEAEKRGWIKLARSVTGFHCLATKKPTQKQRNRLFDYAQAHGRDYEEMIQRLPE